MRTVRFCGSGGGDMVTGVWPLGAGMVLGVTALPPPYRGQSD